MSDQREAPAVDGESCEMHRGDLRELDAARAAMAGCTHVIHLAAIVGGIANFHKLPHTLLEVNNGLYNAVFRAALEERGRASRVRLVLDGVRERDRVPDHGGARARAARPRGPPTASRSSPARSTAARSHDEHGLPYTICRPFNAYGPGRAARRRAGDRARGARPDPQGRCRGSGRSRSSARASRRARSRTSTTSPTGSSPRSAHPPGENEDFNISASRRAHRRRDRRDHLGGVRRDPAEFEFEHLPSFEVDVQRRWPSVEKAGGCSAGRRAIGRRGGHRRHRRAGFAIRKGWPADGREARARSRASRARTARTWPSSCSRRATRCTAWCGAPRRRRSSGSRTSATTWSAAPGRPARPALARRRAPRLQAGRDLQPRRDVLRGRLLVAAGAHGGVHRRRRDAHARGDARGVPGGALLPGVLVRDVREGARGAADRDDARSTRARPTASRRPTATSSPSTTARATTSSRPRGYSSTTKSPRRGLEFVTRKVTHAAAGDQARPPGRARARQPRRRARLGLRARTTSRRCG